MSANTLEEFLSTYNPNGEHPVIEVEVEAADNRTEFSPFIIVRCGDKVAIVNPLGFSDYLDLDIHSFVDGQDATAGVYGMGQGQRVSFPDTGTTSLGWPSAPLVVVLIGEQGTK
jgi:hypothetical protein